MLARLAAIALFLAGSAVNAAEITLDLTDKRLPPSRSALEINIVGDITPGDADRFERLAYQAKADGREFFAIQLNSPGGSLREGLRLGQAIRRTGFRTVVLSNSECSSACVLSFAGSERRYAFRGARIGIHSASINGEETPEAAYGTLIMAREASRLGVPDSLVGRMVTTRSSGMYWLTKDDLVALAGRGAIDTYRTADD